MNTAMTTSALDHLESQASLTRNELHALASELRGKIEATRERLDLGKRANENFAAASAVAGVLAFLCGYALADLFTKG